MEAYKLEYFSCPVTDDWLEFGKEYGSDYYDKKGYFKDEEEILHCIKHTFDKSGHIEYDIQKTTNSAGDISIMVDEILDGTPFTIVDGREIFEDTKSSAHVYAHNFYNMLADIYEHSEKPYHLSDEDWDNLLGHNLQMERDLRKTWSILNQYPKTYTKEERLASAKCFRKIAVDKVPFKPIRPGARTSWIQATFKKVNMIVLTTQGEIHV